MVGFLNNGGTYSGSLTDPTDADQIGVTLQAGFAYQFDLLGLGALSSPGFVLLQYGSNVANSTVTGTGQRRITYTPSRDGGTYYLAISGSTAGSYTVTSAPADDYTNNTATTGTLAIGGNVSGILQTVDDVDEFRVMLTAGFAYQFDLQGPGAQSAGFELLGSVMKIGDVVADGSGPGRIAYTPSLTDTYYLAVIGHSTGSYTIMSAPVDDYPIGGPAGTLAVGGTVGGVFQTVADTDMFGVTLTAGFMYQFDLQSQGGLTDAGFVLEVGGPSMDYSYRVGAGHQRITFIPIISRSYALAATGSTQGSYTITSTPAAPIVSRAPDDFSNDNNSDVLLQNDNGALVIWTPANLAVTRSVVLGNPGPLWHAVAVTDINGDGQPDLLLQNISGAIVDYVMIGTTIEGSNYLGNVGPSWHVRGAADFNHDSNADLLLQNDDGSMVIWTNQAGGITAGTYVGNLGPGYTVEGVADFNGDGTPDILVQNSGGDVDVYLMNRTSIASGSDLGNPGPGWAVAGTGDYNGDGRADILLHNDDGTDVVWDTNGTAVVGTSLIGNPGPSYTGAVAGLDLNGDGVSDLVVQNSDSTLVGYTLNSSGAVTAGGYLGAPGPGWHAIGNDPMEFIDGTHGNTNLMATPGADQFDLTTFAGGLQQITGFDPAQDSLTLSVATFPNYAGLLNNEQAYQGGTFIALTPGTTGAAVVILGVTPGQLSAANFVLR